MKGRNEMADRPNTQTNNQTEGTETVRVLRILEYVGQRKWVEATLRQGLGPNRMFAVPNGQIRMGIVGDFPEPTKVSYSEGVNYLISAVTNSVSLLSNPDLESDSVRANVLKELTEALAKLAYYGNVSDRYPFDRYPFPTNR
jgi:hypothetical protein